MSKGLSIHVGVNYINPKKFGNENRLPWCVNDALAMKAIALSNGFDWLLLLNQNATTGRLLNSLQIASQYLIKGDILFLSFSGHGDQLADNDGDRDEKENGDNDTKDEAWVMYDDWLRDDSLYEAWKKFKSGVRIVVVADCCHAGTCIKPLIKTSEPIQPDYDDTNPNSIWAEKWLQVTGIRKNELAKTKNDVVASVLLLAACDDRETIAASGPSNHSLFTHFLLQVWDNGNFNGDYSTFLVEIARNIPYKYHPQFYTTGVKSRVFERQRPFKIY